MIAVRGTAKLARAIIASVALAYMAGCGTSRPSPTERQLLPAIVSPALAAPAEAVAHWSKQPQQEDIFAAPQSIGGEDWVTLGPFPLVAGAQDSHASLDHDYLGVLGGEVGVRIDSSTMIEVAGTLLQARPVRARSHVVDLALLYRSPADPSATDRRLAYAYSELEQAHAGTALALFGSDDGAAVWVNGKRVHRAPVDRGVDPDADRFEVALVRGKNRILVKVDNGVGGWGFALRILDLDGRQRLARLDARRRLDRLLPRPVNDQHLLETTFPVIAWPDRHAAELVFGSAPLSVRWFGPDLRATERPDKEGRYTAVLEARMRDGFSYRRMLTFAKVPSNTVPDLNAPPFSEVSVPLSFPTADAVKLTARQRAELGRQVWRAGAEALREGESSAVTAAALLEMRHQRADDGEPAWLGSGFVRNSAHQLALRMDLERRTARPLAPPVLLSPPAGSLRVGTERQAGMKDGTVRELRKVARAWAAQDPNGFVVLVARRGVVFLHQAFNGLKPESLFDGASLGKTVGGLLFARAVDQNLLSFDTPLSVVFPEWGVGITRRITFRHCFNHVAGLRGHRSHDGLFNAYLDNALLTQDVAFANPGRAMRYSGDDFNLAGKALELTTGTVIWRLLHQHLQEPFGEPVMQTDLGGAARFNAMYLAKLGQMLLQDGAYSGRRFLRPGTVRALLPRAISEFAPEMEDKQLEAGIGLTWMTDPVGPRAKGLLGPNVVGHPASSGVVWRVALDHQLVVVIGRSEFKSGDEHEAWVSRFMAAVAAGLPD